MISLADQKRCAERELSRRRSTYPHDVKTGRFTQEAAAMECARMHAIVETLDKLIGLEEVSLTMRGEWPKPKPDELFG